MTYIISSLGYNFFTYKKHNKYASDNMVKYYKNSNKKITFGFCDSFNDFNAEWDIYVLLFKDSSLIREKIKKEFSEISPFYAVFDDDYMVITRLISTQIFELARSCTAKEIAEIFLFEMGAILKTPRFKCGKSYKRIKPPTFYKIPNPKSIQQNNHGWFSLNTRFMLEYALKVKKPRVVVELGSWLGVSTKNIIKNTPQNVRIFCFDYFNNVALTDYEFKKPHSLDKFWLTVPRYETFCKNIYPLITTGKEVYTVKYDVNKTIDYMKNILLVRPDVIYIDAIKKTDKLLDFLTSIFKYSSGVYVVGDDYVFDSVKDAVRIFMQNNKNLHLYTTRDAYVICNIKMDIIKYVKSCIGKNAIYTIIEKLYEKKYNEVIKLLDKININKPLPDFADNTFYTLLIYQIYCQNDTNAKAIEDYILKNIDPAPQLVPNSLFLTWKNYKDEKIIF